MKRSIPFLNSAVLATTGSDSHQWNLTFLQLHLEERGIEVTNLGCCTPVDLIVTAVTQSAPDLLVISSVNGHGGEEGIELVETIHAQVSTMPLAVIGGKLATSLERERELVPKLIASGFDGVFVGEAAVADFEAWLNELAVTNAA